MLYWALYSCELESHALLDVKTKIRERGQEEDFVCLNFVPVSNKYVNYTNIVFHVKCLSSLILYNLLFCNFNKHMLSIFSGFLINVSIFLH